MPMKYFALDASVGLIKRALAQVAVTATAYIGTQWDQTGSAATEFITVVSVEAIVTNGAAGETYTLRVVGSNLANRSDGQVLGVAQLGKASVITIESRDTVAGDQVVIRCRSEKVEAQFRYIDLHLTVAGTAPSITFGAYMTKEM